MPMYLANKSNKPNFLAAALPRYRPFGIAGVVTVPTFGQQSPVFPQVLRCPSSLWLVTGAPETAHLNTSPACENAKRWRLNDRRLATCLGQAHGAQVASVAPAINSLAVAVLSLLIPVCVLVLPLAEMRTTRLGSASFLFAHHRTAAACSLAALAASVTAFAIQECSPSTESFTELQLWKACTDNGKTRRQET